MAIGVTSDGRWVEVVGLMPGDTASTDAGSTTRLRESYGTTIDADEDQWRALTGDYKRDLTPVTQTRMREMAVYLWESNLLANRLIELPLAYLLAEGVALKVDDEENQKIIKRFWRDPINKMKMKLAKKVRELGLYGEQCYPTFVNELSGAVRLGYLDPALIETVVVDPDNPEQPIGIVTCKDRNGIARRYKVIVNGPEDVFTQRTQGIRDTFTDGEAFYFTINDLSNGKRGRSDLLAQADWLDGYDQFLFGELDRAQFMRAFVWDVTLNGATADEVTQRAQNISAPAPNSVRVHNDGEIWNAVTPGLQAQESSENARLFRNHILGGGGIPEHWYGGGGDVNRAAAAEMGEPTFKTFSMRQQIIKDMLEEIGVYVLRQAYKAAHSQQEPDLEDEAFEVEAIFPEMTARDTSKYAAALQQVVVGVGLALDKQLITEQTAIKIINSIAGRLGIEIDAEDELAKAKEAAAATAEEDVFVEPPVAQATPAPANQ
jgi:hypothetical protein